METRLKDREYYTDLLKKRIVISKYHKIEFIAFITNFFERHYVVDFEEDSFREFEKICDMIERFDIGKVYNKSGIENSFIADEYLNPTGRAFQIWLSYVPDYKEAIVGLDRLNCFFLASNDDSHKLSIIEKNLNKITKWKQIYEIFHLEEYSFGPDNDTLVTCADIIYNSD